jgi:hypothetical protein
VRVRHYGNTANNAYHNVRLLEQYEHLTSALPVQMFGLRHAISAPAWETVEFPVPGATWVADPDWARFPEADAMNARYSDLPPSASGILGSSARPRFDPRHLVMTAGRMVLNPLYGKRWAQPVFDLSYSMVLGRRSTLPIHDGDVDLFYGADSIIRLKVPTPSNQLACLEHGTVRWIADGGRETAVFRRAYRRQVEHAMQLWVTNLDPRTLEIAEDVAPGRWSALPHPFMPDPRVPFPEDAGERERLLRATDSQTLVLLPSSQNWKKTHDKGSLTALSAFVELRRTGHEVGLIAVEWGLQLAESKEFLRDAGVEDHVAWVTPMARLGLQRMMANVDVVWDQFGLDAFGGLALRVVEQGTPLVSRGLAPIGEDLIGGPPPWRSATTVDDVVRQTTAVLGEIATDGREAVTSEYRGRYRHWLLTRHSPRITAALQREAYDRIAAGTWGRGDARPDRWATWLSAHDAKGGTT